jgi:hypothetical protein
VNLQGRALCYHYYEESLGEFLIVIGKDYDEILGNGHGVSAVPHDVPLVYMRDPRYITM